MQKKSFSVWKREFREKAIGRQDPRKALVDHLPREYGVYLIRAFDERSWYVGETSEHLCGRVRRHNTRSDLVAGRLFEPTEWGRIDLWYEKDKKALKPLEASIYWREGGKSLLNPKIPAETDLSMYRPPDKTVKFIEHFDQCDHLNSFLMHTQRLGEHITTTRHDIAWHRAFELRFNYLVEQKVI